MKIEQKSMAYSKENIYDFDNNIILHEYPRMIMKYSREQGELSELKLLELGLGHGYSAEMFMDQFQKYTVLDGDIDIINKFNREHLGHMIDIRHTFFEKYETSIKFDLIVMGFVLEHVDDPLYIIKKYKSFLKKEGRMYIAVPNAEALNRRLGYEAGLLSDLQQLSQSDIDLGHKRYFTLDSISDMVKEAGMRIKTIDGIYLKPFTTKQIISLNLDDSIMKALCRVGREYPELSLGILLQCEL